jgi:FkbM family methyltransferase
LAAHLRAAAAKDRGWFIEALALDERESEATLNITASDQFSSLKNPSDAETTLFNEMNAVVQRVAVRTGRLDSLFDRYRARLGFRRPFLKMDTQGNDLAVARGAGERLFHFAGLQSELAIRRLYEGQSDFREAIAFYQGSGFVLSGFVPNNSGHFPDLFEIDCVMYNRRFARSAAAP